MYKLTKPLFLLCETPLHAGSGDDLGVVDLPIQRERHTSFPKIESSSLKGALREAFETVTDSIKYTLADWNADDVKVHRLFGFDDSVPKDVKDKLKNLFKRKYLNGDKEIEEDSSEFAGALAFSDARLLLFPVKSMKGVFVWVTCPQVLSKFSSDLGIAAHADFNASLDKIKSTELKTGKCLVASQNVCIAKTVVLEEYAFDATESSDLKDFAALLSTKIFNQPALAYWAGLLKTNLVLLNNDDFRDFVNQSTEVITRTKINNETGTVQEGALFTEEYLPADSVMYSLILASKEYGKKDEQKAKMSETEVMDFFSQKLPKIFQLGGNTTLGKGLLRTTLL